MCEKTTMKIIKCSVLMTIATMCVCKLVKHCIKKHKEKMHEEMIMIAKKINTDIKNTERKTSDRYHDKNQEKYDEMWGNSEGGESCKLD